MKVSLSEQENLTFKEWLGEHYMAVFWIVFVSLIVLIFVLNLEKITNDWNEAKKETDRINEFNREQYSILRYSDDCKKLQQAIDRQLGGGANPDSWFPDYDDKVTKIGQQRYDVLGCKP